AAKDADARADQRRPSYEATQAACQAGAGVRVDDLLADFEEGAGEVEDGEVSFDLSTSDGGFFISAGGGGLNLPLDEDGQSPGLPVDRPRICI
ncbi:unnamed protein product, partial [Effrenium voratum]